MVTEDVCPGGRGGRGREEAVGEGGDDRTVGGLATTVDDRTMVCEGRESVRGDMPRGPNRAYVCAGPRDLTQAKPGTGGNPPLDDVVRQGLDS